MYNGSNFYGDLLHRHNLGPDLVMQSTPCPQQPFTIAAGMDNQCCLLSLASSDRESLLVEEEEEASTDEEHSGLRQRRGKADSDQKELNTNILDQSSSQGQSKFGPFG